MISHTALTFDEFRRRNIERKLRWHSGSSRIWLGPDWGNELAGETGELCNLIKKDQRLRDGIYQDAVNEDPKQFLTPIMKEIGDVVICAELIAEYYGVTLEACIRYAFNKTSEKNGFPERL